MNNNAALLISIIIPCRNEEKFIGQVLSNLISQGYDKNRMEIIVVDGMSTDKTKKIVQGFAKQYEFIKVLDNPQRQTPVALNIGIKASLGDPIIRIDAHTIYDTTYIEKIVETFKQTNADIVGGPMRPIGDTALQQAIVYATSCIFGIGDSKFHNENYTGYVDSVYLGAWRRKLFNDTGYFDENLVRNQDDEFHYRAKSIGKKIFLNPEIKSWYYPRSDFASLAKQYFQYGVYKPYVLKKINSETKLRHLVPFIFVVYLLCLPLSIFFLLWFSPLVMYLIMDIYFSLNNSNKPLVKFIALLVFPIIHISYGAGFLLGLFKKINSDKLHSDKQ